MTFEPHFTNRDENGRETNVDGHDTQWDKQEPLDSYNTTYVPKLMTEEQFIESLEYGGVPITKENIEELYENYLEDNE